MWLRDKWLKITRVCVCVLVHVLSQLVSCSVYTPSPINTYRLSHSSHSFCPFYKLKSVYKLSSCYVRNRTWQIEHWKENNQWSGGVTQPKFDSCKITARPKVLYFAVFHTTITPQQFAKRSFIYFFNARCTFYGYVWRSRTPLKRVMFYVSALNVIEKAQTAPTWRRSLSKWSSDIGATLLP